MDFWTEMQSKTDQTKGVTVYKNILFKNCTCENVTALIRFLGEVEHSQI